MSISRIVDVLFRSHLNCVKTLWFNFRVFPFKTALRFPVLLFGKVCIDHAERGCVELIGPIRPGMVRLGGGVPCNFVRHCCTFVTYINLHGKMKCGQNIVMHNGLCLYVAPGATLDVCDEVFVNINCKLFCEKSIYIGARSRISWDCQVFDSNFHYMVKDGMVRSKSAAVRIGRNCWVGNRVTLSKSASLPDFSIVASNSVVNKDFSQNPEAGMYAGLPARLVSTGAKRLVLSHEKEQAIDRLLNKSNGPVPIGEIEDV